MSNHDQNSNGLFTRGFLLLWLGAAVIRALYLYLYSKQPEWSALVSDSLFHINWADQIAGGDVVGSETFFRSPLYVYLLGLLRWISPDSIALPRIIGSLLGLISIALTYRITKHVVKTSWSEQAALFAAGIQAIYPSLLFFEAELLTDFMFTLLLQISVIGLINYCRKVQRSNETRIGWLVLSGVFLGLACITRANALIVLPVYAYFAWKYSPGADLDLHSRYVSPLVLAIVTLIAIAPVTVRNYVVSGDFTLIASSGGINFYIGNNPQSNPVSASLPPPLGAYWTPTDMRGIAERELGRQLSDAEVSDYWRDLAANWIFSNAGEFAINSLHKGYILFGNRAYSNNRALDQVYNKNLILHYSPLNFSVLFALAMIGILCATEKRVRTIILMTTIIYALGLCLFFIVERFRLPLIVFLIPFAGIGAVALFRLVRSWFFEVSKEKRPPVSTTLAMISGAVALTISLLPYGRPQESGITRSLYLQGNTELRRGEFREAQATFGRLITEDPSVAEWNQNLGVSYFLDQRPDSAEYYFWQALQNQPEHTASLANLASLKLIQGDLQAADSLSTRAFRTKPYDLIAAQVRLRVMAARGASDSIDSLRRNCGRYFESDPRFWYELGSAYAQTGNRSGMQDAFTMAVSIPESQLSIESAEGGYGDISAYQQNVSRAIAGSYYQLGFLAGMQNEFRAAIDYSSKSLQKDSTILPAYINLTAGYYSVGEIDSARLVLNRLQKKFAGKLDTYAEQIQALQTVLESN